jgi:hypothetical protein
MWLFAVSAVSLDRDMKFSDPLPVQYPSGLRPAASVWCMVLDCSRSCQHFASSNFIKLDHIASIDQQLR